MTRFQLTADCVGDIPLLTLAPKDASPALPTVLVLHGLGGSKEKVLPTLYAFAAQGFRAVAPDARLHGGRPGADEREARLNANYLATMYEMIVGTAQDVSALLDHLGVARAAVHGISLGGYITFAALVGETRLAVASVAMGSPDWLGPLRALGISLDLPLLAPIVAENPLDHAPAAYPLRPLLMLHGETDDVVSPAGVRLLNERLTPLYCDAPERLQLILYPDLGHRYTEDMAQRSVAWTQRFL
ncbi:MAG: alpha/beta fold hydrolase [Armatimonadota bacterium]|nr:alpha/beta fold hydrolase [Armatimonadota bacterium]